MHRMLQMFCSSRVILDADKLTNNYRGSIGCMFIAFFIFLGGLIFLVVMLCCPCKDICMGILIAVVGGTACKYAFCFMYFLLSFTRWTTFLRKLSSITCTLFSRLSFQFYCDTKNEAWNFYTHHIFCHAVSVFFTICAYALLKNSVGYIPSEVPTVPEWMFGSIVASAGVILCSLTLAVSWACICMSTLPWVGLDYGQTRLTPFFSLILGFMEMDKQRKSVFCIVIVINALIIIIIIPSLR